MGHVPRWLDSFSSDGDNLWLYLCRSPYGSIILLRADVDPLPPHQPFVVLRDIDEDDPIKARIIFDRLCREYAMPDEQTYHVNRGWRPGQCQTMECGQSVPDGQVDCLPHATERAAVLAIMDRRQRERAR